MSREDARAYKKATGIQCVRPLADKTLWRLANGVVRFVIESAKPFIVRTAHGEGSGATKRWGAGSHPIDEPLGTVAGSKDFAIVSPAAVKYYGQGFGQDLTEPLHTVTTKDRFGFIAASMVEANHGGRDIRTPDLSKPLNVITGKHGYGLVASHLVKFRGDSIGTPARDPVPTITAGQGAVRDAGAAHALGLQSAVLVEVQNASSITGARAVDRPAPTIMANPKGGGWAFSAVHLTRLRFGEKIATSVGAPLQTICAGGNHFAVTASHLIHFHSEKGTETRASSPTEPLPTQDTQNRFGMVAAFLAKLRGSKGWKPCDVPLDVVCAGAPTFAQVAVFLTKFYGTAIGADILKPLSTVTADAGGGHMGVVHAFLAQGVDEASLAGFWRVYAFLVKHIGPDAPLPMVAVKDHLYLIVDLGLRMLTPRELLNAQFTPELAAGYILPTNNALAVKLIGNSVSPPVLEAVIRAQDLTRPARREAA
jgi:DNA (cytosine-5)-methyltransferase 1